MTLLDKDAALHLFEILNLGYWDLFFSALSAISAVNIKRSGKRINNYEYMH
jgi:hypothetical protein